MYYEALDSRRWTARWMRDGMLDAGQDLHITLESGLFGRWKRDKTLD